MALPKLFIANVKFPKAGLELLRGKVEVVVSRFTDDAPESKAEIEKYLPGIDALIWCTKYKLNKQLLDLAGPQLKIVSAMSSGLDHIDTAELKKRNIVLGNTPGVLDTAVADIAVGLLIAAARRFKEGIRELESNQWKYGVQWMIGKDIADSTVGIVGLGGIGQAVVRRLKGFDVGKFLYTGRNEKSEGKTLGAEFVPLNTLLAESDYVILSCPLNEQTKYMINENSLNKMKNTSTLINIGRGELVDQDALYDALKNNKIFSAGLDVVTPEPLPSNHPLISLPNCFIVPHLGSATLKTRDDMAKISAENILLALNNETMKCPVPL